MEFSIPSYGEPSLSVETTRSSQDQAPEPQYVSKRIIRDDYREANCIQRLLMKLNVDSLPELEENPIHSRDSHLLMKQITQMRGVTRLISIGLLVLSLIYLVTRISALAGLYSNKTQQSLIGRNRLTFSNIELVHFFTVAHSVTCVCISVFVYMSVRKTMHIDRR